MTIHRNERQIYVSPFTRTSCVATVQLFDSMRFMRKSDHRVVRVRT